MLNLPQPFYWPNVRLADYLGLISSTSCQWCPCCSGSNPEKMSTMPRGICVSASSDKLPSKMNIMNMMIMCRKYWCWKMTQIRIKSLVSRGISERFHCWIVRENYDKWTRDGSVMGFCHYFMSQCWRRSSHDIWRQSGPAFLLRRTILWYQIYIKREK